MGKLKLYWKGRAVTKAEFFRLMKKATEEELLMCHVCCTPFRQISKYEYAPACGHIPKEMRIGVG